MNLRALLPILAALTLLVRSATAQDRWQLTLRNGTVLWDLELRQLVGDTLVLQRLHGDSTLRLPLMGVDVLRLVQKSEKHQFAPDLRGTGNALMGGADVIWQLTLLDRADRLRVLHQIFEDYPPDSSATP